MANNNKHTGPNVPALRFPEFSGEWESCTFGDVTNNFSRRNKERIQYPMFSVTNNRGFVPQSEQFEDREMVGEDIQAYKVIEKGDFAYNPARINVGSIAKYEGNEKCMISSLYVCFKVIDSIDRNWFMHLLKTPKMNFYYNLNGEGGVRVYLFYPNFARIRSSYPSLVEQKKIAAMLSLIDERIATQSKIIEELKTLRSALRYQLLHEMMVERRVKLGELCKITTGKLDANAMVEGGGYPFFTCAEQVYEIDRYAFDTEALLVSGNGANLGYIHYYCGKFNAYQRTYVLSNFAEDIQYLRQYLEAYLSKRIESEKNTGNTPYIVLGTLADMEIKLPTVTEQQKIAHDLSILSQKIENETHISELFIQEKKTLLGRMFI